MSFNLWQGRENRSWLDLEDGCFEEESSREFSHSLGQIQALTKLTGESRKLASA